MLRRVWLAALVLLACMAAAHAQEQAEPTISLVEMGSLSTLSARAARPLQEVAQLLHEAGQSLQRLGASRRPLHVLAHHVQVHHRTNIQAPPEHAHDGVVEADTPAPPAPAPTPAHTPLSGPTVVPQLVDTHVNAELVPAMWQPRVHDAHRFGTKHPIDQSHAGWVDAAIVGEDGLPYTPRKSYGVTDEPETFRSPFAKYIHPPAVGSSADVATTDPNTKLTPLELTNINHLQLRLKNLLDQLGANIVWDHTSVKNRRLIAEFNDLKVESRALMEEYELRTGVKTIAWQLGDADTRGLEAPTGGVTDIFFGAQPELAGRVLQRRGDRRYPPPPSAAMIAAHRAEQAGLRPKEQRVSLAFKRQRDGTVKAKVALQVVPSARALEGQEPVGSARAAVPGKLRSLRRRGGKGRRVRGRASRPVQIDVVAPRDEELVRNRDLGMSHEEARELNERKFEGVPENPVKSAPKL